MKPLRLLLASIVLAGSADAAPAPTYDSVTILQAPTASNQAARMQDVDAKIAAALAALSSGTAGGSATTVPVVTGSASVFSDYLVNAVFPSAVDPVDPNAKPVGWPSADLGNLTNKASFVFGSGVAAGTIGAVRSRADLDSHFDYAQTNGTAGRYMSDDRAKQANPGAFTAEFRTYPAGNIHDTHVVGADGLYFRAFCAGLGGTVCQGQGNVVTGMARPLTQIVPGDVVEVCRQVPGAAAPGAWATTWIYGGHDQPAGTPNPQFYQPGGYPRTPSKYLESDFPDGYPLQDGQTAEHSLTPQAPLNGTDRAAATLFSANSGGFGAVPGGYTTAVDRSAGVHCYQQEIVDSTYSDSSRSTVIQPGQLIYKMDGVEYERRRDTWDSGPERAWDGTLTGVNPAPSNLMVGLQYGAVFDPNSQAAMTPANVAAAVDRITSIRVWHRTGGTPPDPVLVNAAPAVPAYVPPVVFTPGATVATINGAGFVWRNQATATLATASGVTTITQPSASGDVWSGLLTPIAASGVTTLRLRYTGDVVDNLNAGAMFAKSGSADAIVYLAIPSGNYFQIAGLNSTPKFYGGGADRVVNGSDYCVRFWRDSGKYNLLWSPNCTENSFVTLAAPSDADMGNPTHFGAYVNSVTSSTANPKGVIQIRGYSAVTGSNTQAAGP